MNCDLVQRRLLAIEAPAHPPAEVRRHLDDCTTCRDWHFRLSRMEQQLPTLPTPPSPRKQELIRSFLDAPTLTPHLAFALPPRERGQRKVALAIALAAALAIFSFGWLLWHIQPFSSAPVDPLVQRREHRDRLLLDAPTAQARVQTLSRLAESVQAEAMILSQQDDEAKLTHTAKFYLELVRHDLLQQAELLDPRLRPGVLDEAAARLQAADSAIQRLLASDVKLKNRSALEEMALTARTSRERLLALLHDKA